MTKAVFIQSAHASYADVPGERNHFPDIYLTRVAQTVGDWVILYAGRRGGSLGYHAVQKVERIVADPAAEGHSFALMDRGSLLGFETGVPRLRPDGSPWETGLAAMGGNNTSAVRLIADADFAAIIREGLRAPEGAEALPRSGDAAPGFAYEGPDFAHAVSGPRAVRERDLASRAFREASFARQVKRAYAGRCAMSGLALRNGGGRMEVEAAHILPVAERGPDVVQNGLALSGTLHWMFDRGLVSVDGDGAILVAKGSIADQVADRLIVPDRRLIAPPDPALRPAPAFLRWHREQVFKG